MPMSLEDENVPNDNHYHHTQNPSLLLFFIVLSALFAQWTNNLCGYKQRLFKLEQAQFTDSNSHPPPLPEFGRDSN